MVTPLVRLCQWFQNLNRPERLELATWWDSNFGTYFDISREFVCVVQSSKMDLLLYIHSLLFEITISLVWATDPYVVLLCHYFLYFKMQMVVQSEFILKFLLHVELFGHLFTISDLKYWSIFLLHDERCVRRRRICYHSRHLFKKMGRSGRSSGAPWRGLLSITVAV